MTKIAALIALACTLLCASQAKAEWIYKDRGGQIGEYIHKYEFMRLTDQHVTIDGDCLSACTLLTGILHEGQACVTDRAKLGFHAAWIPNEAGMPVPDRHGRPTTSVLGTEALWEIYPVKVRRWIKRHGCLTRHMIYLKGAELQRIIPPCQ